MAALPISVDDLFYDPMPTMTPTIPEIPATSNTLVLEPSFADLIRTVEQANELPEQRRRHWICSLRQIAKWRDRPVAGIPTRSSSLGFGETLLPQSAADIMWRSSDSRD